MAHDLPSGLSRLLGRDITPYLDQTFPLYKQFTVPRRRKSSPPRIIEAPVPALMQVQRALLFRVLTPVAPHPAATAFYPGRSIVSHARPHHRAAWLHKTDISDFFGSVTDAMIHTMLARRFRDLSAEDRSSIVTLTCLKGRLPQGAPTSPHLANLVLYDVDADIARACSRLGVTYTRYADDIALSGRMRAQVGLAQKRMRSKLEQAGFALHPDKTRTLGPKSRKIITGLDVSAPVIRPPRAFRKKTARLVHGSAAKPLEMARYMDRIDGYLAFWNAVCPGDPEMRRLLRMMANARAAVPPSSE